jgi:hypothetical protein
VSEEGHDSYGNGRDAPNDDLVLATAIATYVATRRRGARITHVTRREHDEAVTVNVDRPDIMVIG